MCEGGGGCRVRQIVGRHIDGLRSTEAVISVDPQESDEQQ